MKHIIAETKINKSNRSLISTIPNTIVSLETLTNVDSIQWSYEIIDNKHIYYVDFIKKSNQETETDENNKKTSSNIDVTTEIPTNRIKKRLSHADYDDEDETESETTSNQSEKEFEKEKNKLMKALNRNSDGTSKVFISETPYEDIQAEKQKEFEDAEKKLYQQLVKQKKNRITNKDKTYTIAIQTNQRKTKTTYKLNFRLTETNQAITNITYNNGTLAESKDILNQLETYTKDEVTKFIQENSTTASKNLKKYGLID